MKLRECVRSKTCFGRNSKILTLTLKEGRWGKAFSLGQDLSIRLEGEHCRLCEVQEREESAATIDIYKLIIFRARVQKSQPGICIYVYIIIIIIIGIIIVIIIAEIMFVYYVHVYNVV